MTGADRDRAAVVTPTVIQFDAADCGPAALAMVMAHHGRPVPVDDLSAWCEVDTYGSRADRLVAAARHHGFAARGVRVSVAAARELPRPFIAHWGDDHFVVVEAVAAGGVTINDPACGRRHLSDRDFVEAFSGVALLLEPASRDMGPPRGPAPARGDALVRALRAGLRGAVGALPHQLARFREDFSRASQRTPRVVVKAVCEEDVRHTVEVARDAAVPVVTRGAGHSRHGQALVTGGIVLVNDLGPLVAQYSMLDEEQVEVTARTRWDALESALNRLGRSLPVVPAYGQLTVGGTLSVGGYGEASVVHGSQLHQVRGLQLVTPSGMPLWCSPRQEPELFRYALGGLGQVGVIERVVLPTQPRRPLCEARYHRHRTRASFLQAMADLSGPTAGGLHVAGFVLADGGHLVESRSLPGQDTPLPGGGEPTAAGPDFRGQAAAGEGIRLAADHVLDLDGLAAYLEVLDGLWRTTSLGAFCDWALVLAVRRPLDGLDFPLEAWPASNPGMAYLVGFYPCVPAGDQAALATARGILRRSLEACLQLGGRPYLYGSHALDEATWLAFYGDGYRRLKALRRALDPDNLCNGHVL